MNRLRSLGFKFLGEPPPKDAPRSQMLRWVRRFYLRTLPLTLLVAAMLIFWGSQAWVFIALGAWALIWLQSVVSLSVRIRREERR